MILSFIFIFIEILLFLFIFHIKFSDRSISCIVKATLSIILIMGWHAFIAAIYGLISIPISLVTIGIGDFILLIVTGIVDHKYGIQNLCNKKEILLIFCIILISSMFGYKFYGKELQVHFWSVDGAAHCEMALTVANKHILGTNLYFSALNNGLAMMICKPFIGEDYLYKVFVAMQVYDLALSGLVYYSVISQFSADKNSALKIVFSILYMLGYPLYSIIFGFSYFGMSITLIAAISLLIQLYNKEMIEKSIFYISINILLFSLFVCYTYFVPVVFAAVFFTLLLKNEKSQKYRNNLKIMKEELIVFLLPCLLGMMYSYSNVKELGNGGGITNEGGCYFDLYSNFLPILFFIILGIYFYRRKKENRIFFMLAIFSIAFFFVLLYLHKNGHASLYYLSKIYNLFWLIAFVFAFEGFLYLLNQNPSICKIFITFCCFFGIICILNKCKIQLNDPTYSKKLAIDYISDIYKFNYSSTQCAYESDKKIKEYQIIKNKFVNGEKQTILSVGSEMDCAWFKTITDQKNRESYNSETLKDIINNKKVSYVYCINSDFAEQNIEYISSVGTEVYSSNVGKVFKIK